MINLDSIDGGTFLRDFMQKACNFSVNILVYWTSDFTIHRC